MTPKFYYFMDRYSNIEYWLLKNVRIILVKYRFYTSVYKTLLNISRYNLFFFCKLLDPSYKSNDFRNNLLSRYDVKKKHFNKILLDSISGHQLRFGNL